MNLLQARTLLRRQLNDVPAVEWPDNAELDSLLNQAYYLVQKEVFKKFPESHLFWDHMNTTGTSWYPLPATFGISEVGLKFASTDTSYTKILRKPYQDVKDRTGTSNTYFTQRGQWIGIFPAPTASVTDGLEVVHTPLMSFAGDTDVPRIKLPLHIAIVWWAKLLAKGETTDQPDATERRLGEVLADIANWYEIQTDAPDQLQVAGTGLGRRRRWTSDPSEV